MFLPGQWIHFEDENGPGFAQPDVLLCRPPRLFLFECKLTFREEAWDQLSLLYSPLCGFIWPNLTQVLVVVFHSLGGFAPSADCGAAEAGDLGDILGLSTGLSPGKPPRFLLHWLGI